MSKAGRTTSKLVEWEPDTASDSCRICTRKWTLFSYRRHHCRHCGKLVCRKCSPDKLFLTIKCKQAVRVCKKCVEAIHSTERPHLPNGVEDEDDFADEETETRSIASAISDGKCKATERPFKNFINWNTPPAVVVKRQQEAEPEEDEAKEEQEENAQNAQIDLKLDEVNEQQEQDALPLNSCNTDATDGSEKYALPDLKEGVKRDSSASTLKLSISKFGTMAFSDEESSHLTTPASAAAASAGEATPFENEETSSATYAAKGSEGKEETGRSGDASPTSPVSPSTTAANSTSDTQSKAKNPTAAAAATSNNGKPKGKIILKKRGSVATDERPPFDATTTTTASPVPPLPTGLSPMPTSNSSSTRRLSTNPRTPFNSAATMSPAAAEIVAAQERAEAEAAAAAVPIATTSTTSTTGDTGDAEAAWKDSAVEEGNKEDLNTAVTVKAEEKKEDVAADEEEGEGEVDVEDDKGESNTPSDSAGAGMNNSKKKNRKGSNKKKGGK